METLKKTKWKIDQAHSEVQFKAKHLVISTVSGQFNDFDAGLEVDEDDLENATAWFTADVNSITTNNSDRDKHLKSDDFFDAKNHPKIKFKSTTVERVDEDNYKMTGNLTIRGITKEITLDVDYGGTTTDPWGHTRSGYEISGKLNRHDFGLKWNAVTETGRLVVGDEIKLDLNIQMVEEEEES